MNYIVANLFKQKKTQEQIYLNGETEKKMAKSNESSLSH